MWSHRCVILLLLSSACCASYMRDSYSCARIIQGRPPGWHAPVHVVPDISMEPARKSGMAWKIAQFRFAAGFTSIVELTGKHFRVATSLLFEADPRIRIATQSDSAHLTERRGPFAVEGNLSVLAAPRNYRATTALPRHTAQAPPTTHPASCESQESANGPLQNSLVGCPGIRVGPTPLLRTSAEWFNLGVLRFR